MATGGGLGGLVPDGVVVAERFGPLGPDDEAGLLEVELVLVATARPARRREVATGRRLAREALAGLDPALHRVPLVRGRDGAPGWPEGTVGSITHCEGYCGAVAARRDTVSSLGVDAEPDRPLDEDVLDLVAGPGERAHLRDLRRRRDDVAWERLLFCAKEATYKAWSPHHGTWLDFEDLEVRLEPCGALSVRLLTGTLPAAGSTSRADTLHGRWTRGHDVMTTAVWA